MLVAALIVALAFGLGAILGAPYLPVLKAEHEALLDLCDLKPGQTLLDLGSGDGRFLKSAAKRGYRAIGYEINPFLYIISIIVTWRERELIAIHLGDYWRTPLPQVEAIYVFLIRRYMAQLDQKLIKDIKSSTTVISYVFPIPNREPETVTKNTFKYRYPIK